LFLGGWVDLGKKIIPTAVTVSAIFEEYKGISLKGSEPSNNE